MWNKIYAKVQAAIVVALPLDLALILAGLNGSTSWRDVLIGGAAIDLPVLAAWFKRETNSIPVVPVTPPVAL